jgi:hypothetical protein
MRVDHSKPDDSMRDRVFEALREMCSKSSKMSASNGYQKVWQVAAKLRCSRTTAQMYLRELAQARRIEGRKVVFKNEYEYRVLP